MYRSAETRPANGNKHILNTTQARQGETSGHVRVILASSLALAFVVFVLLYVSVAG